MPPTTAPTHADYARAEEFLPWNAEPRIFNAAVVPHWIAGGDRFWYRRESRDGASFVVVDPASGERQPAFDHERLAAALSRAARSHFVHTMLPFDSFDFTDDDGVNERAIAFDAAGKRWKCDLATYACVEVPREARDPAEVRSPDGRWAAFARDHNLRVREVASGAERQLTTDGERHHAYAAHAGSSLTAVTDKVIGRPLPPALAWSPDSTRLATYRLDERDVRELILTQSVPAGTVGGPVYHGYREALPGDERIPQGHLLVIRIADGAITPLQVPPVARFTQTPFAQGLIRWGQDSARLYVLDLARGGRAVTLYRVDAVTGAAQRLIEESGPTFTYPHHVPAQNTNVREVGGGDAVTWFSQRDGWGHLYLHDGETGALRAQLTSGAWTVRDVQRVDDAGGWLAFTAGGREAGRDPYYRHLYRCRLDGSDLALLTPEDADHSVTYSPSGAYFVDTHSRVDLPPVSVLRAADGALVCTLEEADIAALTALGWRYPERFVVKARDGVTDLHGTIIRPTNYDPARRYPVLDSIYPGPQIIRTPKTFGGDGPGGRRNFWQDQAIAELGFVVVNIDGLGTPFRSKSFVDVADGANFGEAGGLTDHVAGLRQLAARDASLDLDRVGIFGHSGGGFASARAMCLFPDFFKVAVASSGNHDNAGYLWHWGEFYIGMPDGERYEASLNAALADKLKGKLLLVHGELDDNVHPALTLRLADALIAANKDFDLLIIPHTNHGFFDLRWGLAAADRFMSLGHPYFIRKRWDYFVRHLLSAEPVAGYEIRRPW